MMLARVVLLGAVFLVLGLMLLFWLHVCHLANPPVCV